MDSANAQDRNMTTATLSLSERQSSSTLSFDAFCETLCKGCRKVRWLGKPNPPGEEFGSDWYYENNGGKVSYTTSPQCSLCQQLYTLVPKGHFDGEIYTQLERMYGPFNYRADSVDQTPYDALRLEYGPREKRLEFCFCVVHPQPKILWSSPFRSMRQRPNAEIAWAELRLLSQNVNYAAISECLDYCKRHHQASCTPLQNVEVPGFKVLDCVNYELVTATKLGIEYAALSYVWGTGVGQPTPAQDFPRTIEDGMRVTLSLGLRYLWVDRYVSILEQKTYYLTYLDSVLIKATRLKSTPRSV
jgi:hypothetical protein